MRARYFRYCFILILAVTVANTHAQDASRIYIEPTGWAMGTNFGLADLWGDVGTLSPIDHYSNGKYFDNITFMGGMFGRYTIHPALAAKVSLNYGTIFATDEWNEDLAKVATTQGNPAYQRYARNQNAKTNIIETSLMLEVTPFRINPESKKAHRQGQIYFGVGIGYFHFTPYSTPGTSTKYVKIYDLHLEGDGFGGEYPKAYSLFQACVPMSLGYRWDVGKHLNFGVEYCYRKTFTDYLDGVSGLYIDKSEYAKHMSPEKAALAIAVADKAYLKNLAVPNVAGNARGNPADKDSYSTFSIVFYYKIFTRTKEWWKL